MNKKLIKSIFYCLIILAASTFMWSCGSSDDNDNEEIVPEQVPEPSWTLNLVENESSPTWTSPESSQLPYSMSAIVKLSDFLEEYADNGDEIAAFVGNECRGIASSKVVNDQKLFFISIRGDEANSEKITLKYFSAKNKKTYICKDLFSFEQNGVYGKLSSPALPPFEENGKYPECMEVIATLETPLPFDVRNNDHIAAFVGEDCRGIGTVETVNGQNLIKFNVRGVKDDNGSVYFQYYSLQTSVIYRSTQSFTFKNDSKQGTEASPFVITLQVVSGTSK